MARHGMSAVCAPLRWHRRLVPLILLAISACSEAPDTQPLSDTSEPPLPEKQTSQGPVSRLPTGAATGLRFDVWICGDEAGKNNSAYTFEASSESALSRGLGHQVFLESRRSRIFRWVTRDGQQLQMQFVDDGNLLEWQWFDHGTPRRLTLVNSEETLRCSRQNLAAPANVTDVNPSEPGSTIRLSRQLSGGSSGNRAGGLSAGASGEVAVWVCESANGLLAQAYFAPVSGDVQGQILEGTGINAVRAGRWMMLADDVVRLDLARQGEVILSDLRLEGQTRFTADSDQDGPLTCELESLTFSPSSDRT